MKIGFIGLGKMGGRMVERLLQAGIEVVVLDISSEAVDIAKSKGAIPAVSINNLIDQLDQHKIIWLMVPAGNAVDENMSELSQHLCAGDVIIDGGNSYWRDTVERSRQLKEKGIYLLDCGTSGGVWGLQNGYCLMYGGNKEVCKLAEPIFSALATENGHIYCGESGSGHMVKMIHNGIEYGMMQAYAEGFELMKNSPYNIDLEKVSLTWMHGSVVRSWILELIGHVLKENQELDSIKDYVSDSGEGRWTVQTAMDFEVPAHVITASLFTRFQSRQDSSYSMKLLAATRNQFGGHEMKKNRT